MPGVLSSNGGRDFGSFLGLLGQLGYGFAYRVLDAQYFGVAQRRRRVFVVANSRSWRRAAAVLFEQASLRGDSAPSREAKKVTSNSLTERPDRSGGNSEGQRLISGTLERRRGGGSTELNGVPFVTHSLRAEGFDASEDGTGRGVPLTVGTLSDDVHNGGGSMDKTPIQDELSRCLNAGGMGRQDWETETLVVTHDD